MEPTLFLALAVLVLAGMVGGVLLAQPTSSQPTNFVTPGHSDKSASTRLRPKLWAKD
jgi:hypothetical protein